MLPRTSCVYCKKRLSEEEKAKGWPLHVGCFQGWADRTAAKVQKARQKAMREKAAQERKSIRERRAALKRIPELIKEAQTAFNAYVRERDRDKPCICCGRFDCGDRGVRGHGWDAGHYRSTGSAPHLRFTEDNCHRQLVLCNRYGAGRAVDYRIGLIQRIGLEAVERLESDNRIHRWTREELISLRDTYRAKARELKKEREHA